MASPNILLTSQQKSDQIKQQKLDAELALKAGVNPLPGAASAPKPNPQQSENFISDNPVQPVTSAETSTHIPDKPGVIPTPRPVPKSISKTRAQANKELKEAQAAAPDAISEFVELAEAVENPLSIVAKETLTDPEAPEKNADIDAEVQNTIDGGCYEYPRPRPNCRKSLHARDKDEEYEESLENDRSKQCR